MNPIGLLRHVLVELISTTVGVSVTESLNAVYLYTLLLNQCHFLLPVNVWEVFMHLIKGFVVRNSIAYHTEDLKSRLIPIHLSIRLKHLFV